MGRDPKHTRAETTDSDALLGDPRLRVCHVDPDRPDVDPDEVRLGRVDVDGQAGVGEPLGKPLRAVAILP